MKQELTLTVNGHLYQLLVENHRTLLEVLRDEIGLTGTKKGCDMGECGGCTVLLNGKAVNSCLVLAHEADNQEELHPIQKAFVEHGAIQCGFCTPGMIMTTKALLEKKPEANESEIRKGLSGNICRCTGYVKIIEAVKAARNIMGKGK
jgi:carbon-monoxide dehydrogenase small subunit